MTTKYIPQAIEPKWQAKWEADGLYHTPDRSDKPKYYFLTMYPYPSGDLHIGHWYAEAPADTRARYMRMKGYNVLFPMGFDAFGLPAEEAAIKRNIHPFQWTHANIERMRRQFRSMGAMFDWSREVVTCLPEYYRWNQWFFLQFYKHGLAYRAKAAVDWCPHCNTTLAREQVWGEDRHCERCETPVIKKDLEQWFFKITAYAEELLNFDGIDWPERVKAMQTNWIDKSVGVEFTMPVDGHTASFDVFTTRQDTVYGMTFAVLAPEHPLVEAITTPACRTAVDAYVQQARRMAEIDRLSTEKEKTGVFTGAYAINPMNGEKVPIFVGDYVLMTYGTGAIMGVPAHDKRDFVFAKRYGLPIPVVIAPPGWQPDQELEAAYTDPGMMVNSGPFNGLSSEEGKERIADFMETQGIGRRKVNYRLRDWLISRQRYWGTPIPIIYCDRCGTVPVPEEDLPVLLPEDAEFKPTGESPLKFHAGFLHTTCPTCGGPATRETDTMDTFVDSSWYQYRYLSPHLATAPIDRDLVKVWMPVDQYTGGIEHATMHLMYFRFFTKAMRDIGLVDFDEPVIRLFNQGIILGEDNEKMSKSRGNVVNPDDWVQKLGADTVRAFLMFIGPWDMGGPWNTDSIGGVNRWLNRAWTVVMEPPDKPANQPISQSASPSVSQPTNPLTASERALRRVMHQIIQRATDSLEQFRFNTYIAALMEFTNALMAARETPVYGTAAWQEATETLMLLMAPACPHIAEEMWTATGHPYSVHQQAWPRFDPAAAAEERITLVIQIDGKVRDRIETTASIGEDRARELALGSEKVKKWLEGRQVTGVRVIGGKLVSISTAEK